jgi:uncharacterized protein YjlB
MRQTMIVETFMLQRGPVIPNNPRLAVVVYRQAITPEVDMAAAFEAAFARNGWRGTWRNGIYDYHHYHSQAHEVLGIASGTGRVLLGGPDGREVTVSAGDCLVLPAGTGHCCLSASPDLLVIGAYPPEQRADLRTQAPTNEMLDAISDCPLPPGDPVDGDETLARTWRPLEGRASN